MKVITIVSTLICFFSFLPASRAGRIFTNSLGMKLVYIAPGSFRMGSPESEPGRGDDETLHQVTITKGFYMGSTEVTQGQWTRLMGYNPSAYKKLGKNGPVDQVSWYDCIRFIEKLNKAEKTNKYRLPTEAEWEYACRAGTTTALSGGAVTKRGCDTDPVLGAIAWYCGNSGFHSNRVALKKPNAWGLYDMHGNLQEWCMDSCERRSKWSRKILVITDTYVEGAVDPLCLKGKMRVFRGGSWNQTLRYARSADRNCLMPVTKRSYLGFRIARSK